jgi:tripartite-type tricarboxylate transporter receptor subunit TctC
MKLRMKLNRRKLLRTAVTTAALPAVSRFAYAETFPARPVHLILGFVAGGAPDVVARLLCQSISEKVGQNFLVENRPGAGGNIAAEAVVRSPPDGYTLLLVGSPNFINMSLYKDLKFDLNRDIAPVASIGRNPFVVVVNPSFPAKTMAEFIAYAKANPGKINMTSTGTGNLTHVAGELFRMMAGVDLVHVPSRGEMQAQADLLSDRVQVLFDPIISSLGYIRGGQLRVLGITSATPIPLLPDVPLVGATVPGYEVDGWLGVGAPAGTPPDVIATLNKYINDGLADPTVKAKLVELGFVPTQMTADAWGKFVAGETDKWAKVIKFAGVKLE